MCRFAIVTILTGCAATNDTITSREEIARTPMSEFAPELAGTPYDALCGECAMYASSGGCASVAKFEYIAVATAVELSSSKRCKRSIEPFHEMVWEDCLRTADVRFTWQKLLRGPAPLPDNETFEYRQFDNGPVDRGPPEGILEPGRPYVIFLARAPGPEGWWTFHASCPVRTEN